MKTRTVPLILHQILRRYHAHDGPAFRTLNVLEEFPRESLAIRVRRKLSSTDILELLTDLFPTAQRFAGTVSAIAI